MDFFLHNFRLVAMNDDINDYNWKIIKYKKYVRKIYPRLQIFCYNFQKNANPNKLNLKLKFDNDFEDI